MDHARIQAASSAAPTNELGAVLQGSQIKGGLPPWSQFVDTQEWVPDLMWPMSIQTYEYMRSDSQLAALFNGVTLPIRHFEWMIDPNGCDDNIVESVANDLNLPIEGEQPKPKGRMKKRFIFKEHLRIALLALLYGHMYFEQVGEIDDEDGQWHMRKLAERMPKTIAEINVAEDGGLVSIKQNISKGVGIGRWGELPEIPVDRLVGYIWEGEGGNWVGRSIMRDCYKNWLVKDRLVRIDAINHARAGGVPIISAQPGATPGEITQMAKFAQEFRIGEDSGGAVPYGSEVNIARATGTDVVASMRYHDEAMARKFLLMFLQLGQTQSGSRALGQTFHDFFAQGQDAIAWWFMDIFNEHVIEDYVDWNWEGQDNVPLLKYERDPELAVADLTALIDADAIVVDADLENELRRELGLPNKMPGAPDVEPFPEPLALPPGNGQPPPGAPAEAGRAVVGAGSIPSLPLPNRPLRRQPYEHEIAATTDFAALDEAFQRYVGLLITEWAQVKSTQVMDLHDQIISAKGDIAKLAEIAAKPSGGGLILTRMQDMASSGIQEALAEATRQGIIDPDTPSIERVMQEIEERAVAVESLLASSLSESARAKAIHLSGVGADPPDVALAVVNHLNNLSNKYLEDQFGGTLQAAQNAGRRATMIANDADQIYASEILDHNTCGPCIQIDGRTYDDPLMAARDYPSGGYKGCLGGPRCRGTLVAIYGKEG